MSYCEVDFSGVSEEAERVEFADVRWVTARKAHRCIECRGEIASGESYQRAVYKFEGTMSSEARCEACAEAKAEFEYDIYGGGFWDHMREEWDQGAHIQSCIQRLTTVCAKAHMRRQWLKWKGLAAGGVRVSSTRQRGQDARTATRTTPTSTETADAPQGAEVGHHT